MNDAINPFRPSETECERASASYLMSLVALIAGLPLPIINLIATFIFYAANRKSTWFVRWHCTQALLSQCSVLVVNSFGFWWTVSILFGPETVTNRYVAYIITLIMLNIGELFATIYSSIMTRKGVHVKWWLYGELADMICRP